MSTALHIMGLIRQTCSVAVKMRLISSNPARDVELNRITPRSREEEDGAEEGEAALTVQEQQAFLRFVQRNPSYTFYYPMFLFAFGSAVRGSELCGITRADVITDETDPSRNGIRIWHQLHYDRESRRLTLSAPKTARSHRIVHARADLTEALRLQEEEQTRYAVHSAGSIDGRSDFLFLQKNGRPFRIDTLNHLLKRIVSAYNRTEVRRAAAEGRSPLLLPHMTSHIFRHTGITRMIEMGVPVEVVSREVGHARITTTLDIYTQIHHRYAAEELRKATGAAFGEAGWQDPAGAASRNAECSGS